MDLFFDMVVGVPFLALGIFAILLLTLFLIAGRVKQATQAKRAPVHTRCNCHYPRGME